MGGRRPTGGRLVSFCRYNGGSPPAQLSRIPCPCSWSFRIRSQRFGAPALHSGDGLAKLSHAGFGLVAEREGAAGLSVDTSIGGRHRDHRDPFAELVAFHGEIDLEW